MNAGKFVLISALVLAGLRVHAQEIHCVPKENIDWSQLNPTVLDMAFDLLEDLDLQAEALDESDEVYSPREADSEKLSHKINRIKSTDADQEVICPLAEYQFAVGMHRLGMKMPVPCTEDKSDVLCHPMSEIEADREKAKARLAEIQQLYKAAQQKKSKPPAKKGTKSPTKG